jgi:hypothetical protein
MPMFSDARPIDLWMLVIELLVLVLIAYEVAVMQTRQALIRGKNLWTSGVRKPRTFFKDIQPKQS